MQIKKYTKNRPSTQKHLCTVFYGHTFSSEGLVDPAIPYYSELHWYRRISCSMNISFNFIIISISQVHHACRACNSSEGVTVKLNTNSTVFTLMIDRVHVWFDLWQVVDLDFNWCVICRVYERSLAEINRQCCLAF